MSSRGTVASARHNQQLHGVPSNAMQVGLASAKRGGMQVVQGSCVCNPLHPSSSLCWPCNTAGCESSYPATAGSLGSYATGAYPACYNLFIAASTYTSSYAGTRNR